MIYGIFLLVKVMEKIYKREEYLKKVRGFYHDSMIKVITGMRRCGKSFLMKSIINELIESGVKKKDIIYIELDEKKYLDVTRPSDLEKIIDSLVIDDDFKYLFIDEVQNVKNYEKLINAYNETNNFSIFLTGSNSYLLSGELTTKLSGRYIEIEVFPLNFYEYKEMKMFLGKEVNSNIFLEFDEFIRNGGLPRTLYYDNNQDKLTYTKSVLNQIFEKDIKSHKKIKNTYLFDLILKFVVNNFGSIISVKSIYNFLTKGEKISVDRRTIKTYISILEKAKIIYSCPLFDIKSKRVLKGEAKYYLSDLSIYYAFNTDNLINYGPVLENVLFEYLRSKNYSLSVGRIGNLECDFIARKEYDKYFYIQVSKSISDEKTLTMEFKPFYDIKEFYPRYLFLLDYVFKDNDIGVNTVNIAQFIYDYKDL